MMASETRKSRSISLMIAMAFVLFLAVPVDVLAKEAFAERVFAEEAFAKEVLAEEEGAVEQQRALFLSCQSDHFVDHFLGNRRAQPQQVLVNHPYQPPGDN